MRASALAALLLGAATAQGAPPHHRRLPATAVGVAYWSADGRSFFVAHRDGDRLLRFDRSGAPRGGVSVKAAAELSVDFSTPRIATLSVDSKTLAFIVDAELSSTLHVVSLDSGSVRSVAPLAGLARDPIFTRDGGGVLVTVLADRARVEQVDLASREHRPVSTVLPFTLGAAVTGDGVVVAADRLYRVAGDGPLVTLSSHHEAASDHPEMFAISPHGSRALLLVAAPGVPEALWIEPVSGPPVRVGPAASMSPIVWLDDDRVLYEIDRGAEANREHTLMVYSLAARRGVPVAAPEVGCSDGNASVPPGGGVLVYQRACTSKAGYDALWDGK